MEHCPWLSRTLKDRHSVPRLVSTTLKTQRNSKSPRVAESRQKVSVRRQPIVHLREFQFFHLIFSQVYTFFFFFKRAFFLFPAGNANSSSPRVTRPPLICLRHEDLDVRVRGRERREARRGPVCEKECDV